MNDNSLNHNNIVQVENNKDMATLRSENYMSAVSPSFTVEHNETLSFSNIMSPNTPQMRILSSPMHILNHTFASKTTEDLKSDGCNLQNVDKNIKTHISNKLKRSFTELEKTEDVEQHLHPDDIPMRTDYGTLEELLDEIGLPSTKATGLYDASIKPPYSYAAMIALSIMVSGMGQLTLSQIYQWISSHFPFYKLGDSGWQNSIRHNLSLNSAFFKGGKSSDGKGHFWRLTPGQELKILKIQAKPSTKNKSKKVQNNNGKLTADKKTASESFSKVDSISGSISYSRINSNTSAKLVDSIKEDDTLVSSSSSFEKNLTFTRSNVDGSLNVNEDVEAGYKDVKKSKQDYAFSEKYNDLLTTPVKYKFASIKDEENHIMQPVEGLESLRTDFNTLRKINEFDEIDTLMNQGKFTELEQSFQCSFNTSFDSPKPATNLGSSPLIECHSKSKLDIKRVNSAIQSKISIGRTTTMLIETPRKEEFNEEGGEDKYGKITVGNVMLSRTPLKPSLSPFPSFSMVNNHTNNHINTNFQKNTPRWKTPSYDDFFVSPFFKSPRSHQFCNNLFFNDNNHSHINAAVNRRHSTTDVLGAINTNEKSTNMSAKKLEPALLGLKSQSSLNADDTEKNSDEEL